jgi:hypothetical protein
MPIQRRIVVEIREIHAGRSGVVAQALLDKIEAGPPADIEPALSARPEQNVVNELRVDGEKRGGFTVREFRSSGGTASS